MIPRVVLVVALLAQFLALVDPGAARAVEPIRLRFAHTVPTEDTPHRAIVHFANLVKERTGGRVEIQIFPAAQLGTDLKVIEGTRLGTIDMCTTGNPFFTNFNAELNLLDLPYQFRDHDHVYKVLDGPIGQHLTGTLDKHGLKGLGNLDAGFRIVTTKGRPVKTVADVAGVKMRVVPNPAHVLAWKLLGAIPTPTPFPEVYLALKTGTIDAQETTVIATYASKFHEVQKYLSMTWHAYTVFQVVMNPKKYEALPPDVQRVLVESTRDAFVWHRNLNRQVEITFLDKMREAGIVVEENPDREAFRRVVADAVTEDYVKRFGPDLLRKLRDTR
jgi:tripartite ATP-independent transporter DctP family solute receptor